MGASKIKILIVSRTPWNEANSFGNTFTNLFEGMENVKIANICCQGGAMNSRLIEESFQLTDKDVCKSIIGPRPGHLIKNNTCGSSFSKPNVPRKAIFYALREVIWLVGRWKSKKLNKFIKDFNPDILYLPIYRSHYMCAVDKYIIKLTGVPYVVHITDDIYNYPPNSSCITKQLQRIIRSDIRQILKNATYGEVFSPVMAKEYSNEFTIPFHLIGKSVNIKSLPPIPEKRQEKVIRFVYTGNFGGERGKQLIRFAQVITETFPYGTAVLYIYSATRADEEIQKQLENIDCVELKGAVSPDKILATQQAADYLVHVEGFSSEAIFESRLSFSTKIIDYLIAARPIIAIGPKEVTSMQVLKDNDMAHIAGSVSELVSILKRISGRKTDDEVKVNNGRKYLLKHRNSELMKTEIFHRIEQLVKQ